MNFILPLSWNLHNQYYHVVHSSWASSFLKRTTTWFRKFSNFSEMLVYSLQIFLLPLGFLLGSKCIIDLTLTTLKSATKNFSPWPNLEIRIFIYRQFNEIFFFSTELSKKHPICAKKPEFKVNKTNVSKLIPPLHQKQWKMWRKRSENKEIVNWRTMVIEYGQTSLLDSAVGTSTFGSHTITCWMASGLSSIAVV